MRRNLTILLALILWSILMIINVRFEAPKEQFGPTGQLISGITNPGLVMQFVHTQEQVFHLLGDPGPKHDKEPWAANQKVMRQQQYLDFVFIVLYWGLFVFVVSPPMRQSKNRLAQRLGWLALICITVAAIADYVEDAAILSAINLPNTSNFWPYHYAIVKWSFFFITLGLSSPLFLLYPKFGNFTLLTTWTKWPRLITGPAFLAGSILGLIGIASILARQNGVFLKYAEAALLAGFLSLLVFFLPGVGFLQSFWNDFVSWSIYIYALRVPLLACAFLVLFPILDLISPGFAKASRGILSLENHSQLIFVSFLSVLTCWLAMILSRVILAYGSERFSIGPEERCQMQPPIELRVANNMSWGTLLLWTIPGWPILARVLVLVDFTSTPSIFLRLLDLLAGFLIALAFLFLAAWIHLHEKNPNIPLNHAFVMPIISPLTNAYQSPPFSSTQWFKWFFFKLGPGYIQGGILHSGHSMALVFSLLLLILYLIGYFFLMPNAQNGVTYFPVLCYVLILIMIILSCGAAFSFFADRYRWPVLTLIVVYSIVFNSVLAKLHFSADHYYAVPKLAGERSEKPQPAQWSSPQDVAMKWQASHSGDACPMVVVTATGGGIVASAWTAEVLTQLDKELNTAPCGSKEDNTFSRSIVLISSVSGGSVGAMYFAEELAERSGALSPAATNCGSFSAPQAAQSSSLREAGWGLVYPDILRVAFPVFAVKTLDRGWALEQAWKRCWPGADRTLYSWAQALNAGKMPAVIFNATTAETGQRFLITNYLPPVKPPEPCDKRVDLYPTPSFVYNYPGYDLPVVTAARLSATFPYVSAMARADIPGQTTVHIGDGGYYDNYGVSSAIEWLIQAIPTKSPCEKSTGKVDDKTSVRKLLWIEIEASPAKGGQAPDQVEKGLPNKEWDWTSQLVAPLSTMMSVRTSGQAERNEVTLRMLNDLRPEGMEFQRVIFAYHDPGAPLSWHLTKNQQKSIYKSWDNQVNPLKQVKTAFGYK